MTAINPTSIPASPEFRANETAMRALVADFKRAAPGLPRADRRARANGTWHVASFCRAIA